MSEVVIITGAALAQELRKLADAVENVPRVNNSNFAKPYLWISYRYGVVEDSKAMFTNMAKALPRPVKKVFSNDDFQIVYDTPAIKVELSIDRSTVCELIEPAKPAVYRCAPLMSAEDESEILGNVAVPEPVIEDELVEAVAAVAGVAEAAEAAEVAEAVEVAEVVPDGEISMAFTEAEIADMLAAPPEGDAAYEALTEAAPAPTTLQEAAEAQDELTAPW
jgi:hypothetical protein